MTITTVAIIPRPTNTVATVTATIVMAGEIGTTIGIGDGGVATAMVIVTIAARAIGEIMAAMADAIRPATKIIREGIGKTATPTMVFTTLVGFTAVGESMAVATIPLTRLATRKEPLAAILDSAMVTAMEPKWRTRICPSASRSIPNRAASMMTAMV